MKLSLAVVMSLWLLAFDRAVYHWPLFFFILARQPQQRVRHDGPTVHTTITTLCVTIMSTEQLSEKNNRDIFFFSRPHTNKSVSHVRRMGNTLHERLELGTWLSWLSLPVATVTDVLFNTRAGSRSGWSEYKLAQCLLQGGCIANVATKYFTCKLIPLQSGLMGHLCSSCYFTLFSLKKKKNPKETV